MDKKAVSNLLEVWKSKNNILKPIDAKVVLAFVNQISSLFSSGNFFYFLFNFSTLEMEHVSDDVQNVLGISPDKFSFDFFLNTIHPEDLVKIHEKETAVMSFKLNKIQKEELTKYKTVYLLRYKTNDGNYKTILHQSKVINVSEDGKINHSLSVHTDLSHLNIPMDHKVSFIHEDGTSFFTLDNGISFQKLEGLSRLDLTNREIQILREISKGGKVNSISQKLNISPHTINTHKRNILKKSQCKNMAELITKCIREGII